MIIKKINHLVLEKKNYYDDEIIIYQIDDNINKEKKKYPYNGFEKIENLLIRKLYQKFPQLNKIYYYY